MKLLSWILVIISLLFPHKAVAKAKTVPPVPAPILQPVITLPDARVAKLDAFAVAHNCPKPYYSNEYIQAADRYQLDWRLLPSISVIESSCGRHYLFNNYFGWNSARTGFSSVPEGIDFVSNQLQNGHPYKGKSLERKIKTYNSANPNYWPNLVRLMNQIK